MCGIFFIISRQGHFSNLKEIIESSKKLNHRGPDCEAIIQSNGTILGFYRLAINDLSNNGMQPFHLSDKNSFTMCNGEIYNYHSLLSSHSYPLKSSSDCEILPHLIHDYGFESTISMIDGVFALFHMDLEKNTIYVGRDRIGVKPIFYAVNDLFFAIASEAKSLEGLGFESIHQLIPTTYMKFSIDSFALDFIPYDSGELHDFTLLPTPPSYEEASKHVSSLLRKSVEKRLTSDREIGCLLSGGLDSSLVASILSNLLKEKGQRLHTFSVGFPDSTDIKYARIVSEHIGSIHHELLLDYKEAFSKIEDVVYATETYDTTTIRASTPMFLLCEWINKEFPHRVIFSGEGSDELFCGYLYFHLAPTPEDAHNDSMRLLKQLYQYDVLRADRCTAGNGLEFREPFLDKELIDYVISLPNDYIIPKDGYEKYLLRSGFTIEDLPECVLWRRKAAFSDAVSSGEKPWYKWIQEFIDEKQNQYDESVKGTLESRYYRALFSKYFKSYQPNIPLWLPKWTNVGDEPSATVLSIFDKKEH